MTVPKKHNDQCRFIVHQGEAFLTYLFDVSTYVSIPKCEYKQSKMAAEQDKLWFCYIRIIWSARQFHY